jgi:vancomycin permeability regulator SanA
MKRYKKPYCAKTGPKNRCKKCGCILHIARWRTCDVCSRPKYLFNKKDIVVTKTTREFVKQESPFVSKPYNIIVIENYDGWHIKTYYQSDVVEQYYARRFGAVLKVISMCKKKYSATVDIFDRKTTLPPKR